MKTSFPNNSIALPVSLAVLMSLAAGCANAPRGTGPASQEQAQEPKPGPEQKKLEVFLGTWKFNGECKAGPLGPAATFSGQWTARWILNGFFVEIQSKEKGPGDGVQETEVNWYDPATKSHQFQGFENTGDTWSGSGTLEGRRQAYTGTLTHEGTAYKFRGQNTFSADGKTMTRTNEVSVDGNLWTPWFGLKATK